MLLFFFHFLFVSEISVSCQKGHNFSPSLQDLDRAVHMFR